MSAVVVPGSCAVRSNTRPSLSARIASSGTDFNVHPTLAGYAVIADQVILATAPEPSSLVLLATGLLGVLGYGWRRGSAAA